LPIRNLINRAVEDRYDNEKADALAKLAGLIERIVNPPADNVVALRG
jgi:hypothetical protein